MTTVAFMVVLVMFMVVAAAAFMLVILMPMMVAAAAFMLMIVMLMMVAAAAFMLVVVMLMVVTAAAFMLVVVMLMMVTAAALVVMVVMLMVMCLLLCRASSISGINHHFALNCTGNLDQFRNQCVRVFCRQPQLFGRKGNDCLLHCLMIIEFLFDLRRTIGAVQIVNNINFSGHRLPS